MAISIVGTVTGTSGAATAADPSLTLPAGLQDGDLGILRISTANTGAMTLPSGWTQIGTTHTSGSVLASRTLYKSLTAAESSTAVTATLSATKWTTACIVLRGAVIPHNASATNDQTSNTTAMVYPSITPTVDNALLIMLASFRLNTSENPVHPPATGWTEHADLVGGAVPKNATAIATRQLTLGANSATGTASTTLDSDAQILTRVLAIEPTPVAPDAPTIGTATAGDAEATVAFTPPAYNGGAAITGYTATSSPGGLTGTGASSPITVTGLSNGTAYTFTVTATNSVGTGAPSAASNSVTPQSSGAPGVIGDTFATTLNRLAGTTNLSSTEAANVWAGTTNLCLNDALNIAAGNSLPNYKALGGVCNQLAGTTDLSPMDALSQVES